MLLSEFVDYLSLEKNYSSNTVKSYKRDIASFQEFCLEEFDGLDIDKVHYGEIRNWIVSLSESGVVNRSINRKISSLNTYYKFLIKIKQIKVNPLAKHKSLKVAKKVQVPFSSDEIVEVIELIKKDVSYEGLRDRLIIELLYATGIRRSELIGLKKSNVDLNRKTIKVLGKRNKERIIPLIDEVVETITHYMKYRDQLAVKEDLVFVSKSGKEMNETFVYRVINSYFSMVSTKVKKSPHILRHSFATHLLNNGAHMNAVKELLGHSSLASTEVYTHNNIDQLKKVYAKAHPRNQN